MHELTQVHYLLLGSTALLGGMLSAITGGGALMMLPALLITGLPPQLALGTNKFFTTASLFTSSIYFIKRRLFNPMLWLAATIATLLGSLIGAGIALIIPDKWLSSILAICFITMSIYFMFPSAWSQAKKSTGESKPSKIISNLTSSLIGIYSGFVGAGTSSIWTAVAIRLFKLEILEASAMSRVMCFTSNASALLIFVMLKQVDYVIGGMLVILGVAGAKIGAHLCLKHGVYLIRPLITGTTGIMAIKLTFDACV